jgi:putative acetyltransferase
LNFIVRPELHEDELAIRAVNEMAFGREDEAKLVDSLRDHGFVQLSLVAVEDDKIVGHILFSELHIVDHKSSVNALALAPLAVTPSKQRQGVGSALTRAGLQLCANQGHRIVLVVGHPGYYPRFGFSTELARRLKSPYSGDSFMVFELVPGALEGVTGEVRYARPFDAF